MRILENGYMIRRLGLESINDLANLHKASFSAAWGAHDFALFMQNRDVILIGAIASGKSVPVAFLLVRKLVDEAEVISIATARRHQRAGLARGMMETMIDLLYDEGITALHLEVDEQNGTAVHLYQGLGFDIVGERRAYYPKGRGERAANALMMTLPLTDE